MIMSQVIAHFSCLYFHFPFSNWTELASTTSVLRPRSSNISSPSEEEEQAIRPINKREAHNQREPGSLFCHCTRFTTRSSVKYGPTSQNSRSVVSNKCPAVCTPNNTVRAHMPQPANIIFNDLFIKFPWQHVSCCWSWPIYPAHCGQ